MQKKKYFKENKASGITLIALVITIIVLLILVGISISTLTGENGILTRANEAKIINRISQIKEEVELYRTGKYIEEKTGIEAYPIEKNEAGERLTIKDILSQEELDNLPESLRYEMLSMTTESTGTQIPSLDQLDYSKFYKLDTEVITSTGDWKDRLVIWINGDDYKVIHVDGVTYQKEKVYIIIPLNNEEEPEYITTGNNTYKFYGDGTVKVVGENGGISGMTSEESKLVNGVQELDIEAINEQFGNPMALPEKKMYISCDTIYIIDQNDDLWAWGDNTYNKLGQGNSFLVTEPTKILEGRTEGATGVKAKDVWAGYSNTFVLDTENRLWACGTNASGTLGQGNTNIYQNFVQIKNIDGSQIQKIAVSTRQYGNNAFIIYKNKEVYAAGSNNYGSLGIGNNTDQTSFILLSNYNSDITNVKDIKTIGVSVCLLKENGDLLVTGHNEDGQLGTGDTINKKNWVKLAENIEQIEFVSDRIVCKDTSGKIYNIYNSKINEVTNIVADSNNQISSGRIIISQGKMYYLAAETTTATSWGNYENVEAIQAEGSRIIFKSEWKIYATALPNITKPKQKSIYQLKTIFEDAIFMQGASNTISIVNKQGEIYENLVKNNELQNVKKLKSSSSSRYAITKDGKLYAKGGKLTGMWGEVTDKNNYIQVTKDGTEIFNNVKDIYTSQAGQSAIFTTTDGKLYWAGSTAYLAMPGVVGDIVFTGSGGITSYPKEVSSPVIDAIKENIKDINYHFINSVEVSSKTTYITTENGKLYVYGNNQNSTGTLKTSSDFEELVIKEGTTVVDVKTADGLTLAVLSNGEIYGWGYNTYGILGDGYEVGGVYPTPVKLNLPNNIKSVSLGTGFAIFASKTGEVYGIGRNDYGQLGTGDNKGASTFVRCPELEK